MDNTYKIAKEYIFRGHELGKSFSQEEAHHLVGLLRLRLKASSANLDLSPESLEYLADYLLVYYKKIGLLRNKKNFDEIMQLTREIASYIGLVLVLHSGGEWDQGRALDSLQINFCRIKKATIVRPESKIEFSIGLYIPALTTISALDNGMRPNLFFLYKNSKSNRKKEILG